MTPHLPRSHPISYFLIIETQQMSLTQSSAGSIASAASVAARRLAVLSNAERNEALTALYEGLLANKDAILAANAKDVALASRAAEDGDLNSSVLKRLDLSRPGKYDDMLQGILSVRGLNDPSKNVQLIQSTRSDLLKLEM